MANCILRSHARAGIKLLWRCMRDYKHVLRRSSVNLLGGKTNCLHVLVIDTWRSGIFVIESNGVNWLESCQWFSWWCLPLHCFWKTARTSVMPLFVSHVFALYCVWYLCFMQWSKWEGMNLQLNFMKYNCRECLGSVPSSGGWITTVKSCWLRKLCKGSAWGGKIRRKEAWWVQQHKDEQLALALSQEFIQHQLVSIDVGGEILVVLIVVGCEVSPNHPSQLAYTLWCSDTLLLQQFTRFLGSNSFWESCRVGRNTLCSCNFEFNQ